MMTTRAISSFDVTGWDHSPYDDGIPGPSLSRAKVRKAFRGDLVGESTAELLMCQADAADLNAGAGYIGSERVVGKLAGREGSFVIQHWGVSGGGLEPRTAGHIVPGSGTGELVGLTGEVQIMVGAGGEHTLTLDYEIL
jgi:hypothetical protein